MPDLIEGAGYEPTEAVDATTVSLLDEKNVDTEGPPSEETIVRWIKADIDDAEELQDELREIRRQCYQLYRGKNADKEREGRSNIVSTEIMNAVEWVIPSLMRIYFQSDQIVVCEGMGPEDVPKGEQMTRVLNDMFTRRQGGFIKCLKWFKDALVYGLGAGKITWEEEFQESELYYKELPEDAFDLLTSDPTIHVEHYVVEEEEQETAGLGKLATMFGIPSQPSEPLVKKTYSDVRVTEAVKTYEGIAFEVLPLEDYLYDPKAEDTGDCDYQIHRVELSIDECLRREEEGIYKNVDELISIAQTGQEPNDGRGDAEEAERYAENNRTDPNSINTTNDPDQIGRQKVTVYEWWGDLDIDGTGKLKPYVVAVCEDVLIRCDPNPYNHQNPPFVTLRPMLDIHTFEGIGMADLLKEEQQTLTAITRQYLDNLSWQNNGMWETDRNARVEMSSLLKPRPGGVVRTDRIGSVKSLAPPDIASQALQGIEFMRDACQAKSGVTRYSQGLDADSLNKTATGITAIMSKSDARIELIARTFAETGVRDLFVMANSLVQQFMTMDYSVRVYGEPIQVAPDDVKGNFDIIVSVGTNPGRQEQIAQQMLQLINMSGALMQNGVMTADNMYQIVIKLLECWGHKDTEHYLTDPQVMQQMQGTIQGLRQQIIQLTGVDPFGQQQQQPGNAGGGPGGPGIPGQMPAGGSGGPPGAPQTLSG